ncbi:MAG: MlaD family protein [Thermoleophilaceae bacterium]
MSRRGAASVVASPVLVGAVTVLVTVVAVILAYNANQGLPFVPQYTLSATLPGAANLVEGNEVRVGGFRVGLVDAISTKVVTDGDGRPKSVAVVRMKLDKIIEELPRDSRVIVRPRSALGLKYIELTPGSSTQTFKPGATLPLASAEGVVEFDDLLSTFQDDVRDDAQQAQEGFGTALAGRGPAINQAINEFVPFFSHLGPVMSNLSAPNTELDRFFKEIGETTGDIARSCAAGPGAERADTSTCAAPVSLVNARMFSEMADTFDAISRSPRALRGLIEKTAPTNYSVIRSIQPQKPFLREFASLSSRLRPAARELPRSLPDINDALITAQPVLPRTVALNNRTADLFKSIDELAENPNTLLGIRDLGQTVRVGAPFAEYIAPYQTVCNYVTYSFNNLGENMSEIQGNAQAQRIQVKTGNNTQDDRLNDSNADRPADVPSDQDEQGARDGDQEGVREAMDEINREIDRLQETRGQLQRGVTADALGDMPAPLALPAEVTGTMEVPQGVLDELGRRADAAIAQLRAELEALDEELRQPLQAIHGQPYQPAIDGDGNADCQNGQNGYLDRLVSTSRYPPSPDPEQNGGSHVVLDSDSPGLAGPTFTGVPNLEDVDREQRSRHPDGEVPER